MKAPLTSPPAPSLVGPPAANSMSATWCAARVAEIRIWVANAPQGEARTHVIELLSQLDNPPTPVVGPGLLSAESQAHFAERSAAYAAGVLTEQEGADLYEAQMPAALSHIDAQARALKTAHHDILLADVALNARRELLASCEGALEKAYTVTDELRSALAAATSRSEEAEARAAAAEADLVHYNKVLDHGKGLCPNWTHAQVANKVRMLTRSDLDHELIVVMARDRIILLADELAKSKAREAELKQELAEQEREKLAGLALVTKVADAGRPYVQSEVDEMVGNERGLGRGALFGRAAEHGAAAMAWALLGKEISVDGQPASAVPIMGNKQVGWPRLPAPPAPSTGSSGAETGQPNFIEDEPLPDVEQDAPGSWPGPMPYFPAHALREGFRPEHLPAPAPALPLVQPSRQEGGQADA